MGAGCGAWGLLGQRGPPEGWQAPRKGFARRCPRPPSAQGAPRSPPASPRLAPCVRGPRAKPASGGSGQRGLSVLRPNPGTHFPGDPETEPSSECAQAVGEAAQQPACQFFPKIPTPVFENGGLYNSPAGLTHFPSCTEAVAVTVWLGEAAERHGLHVRCLAGRQAPSARGGLGLVRAAAPGAPGGLAGSGVLVFAFFGRPWRCFQNHFPCGFSASRWCRGRDRLCPGAGAPGRVVSPPSLSGSQDKKGGR